MIHDLKEPDFVLVDFVIERECLEELREMLVTAIPELDLPEELTGDQAVSILVDYVLSRSPKVQRVLEAPRKPRKRHLEVIA